MSWLRHELPLPPRPWWVGAWTIAIAVGLAVASSVGPGLDRPLHDHAVAAHARPGWDRVAVVVLDDGVPPEVGRVAMLPLWARAAEAATGAGALAVYLDAAVVVEVDAARRFAKCLLPNGSPDWSRSSCVDDPEYGCGPAELVSEPLKLSGEAAGRFFMLPSLGGPHLSDAACASDERLDHGAARRLLGSRAGDATVSCADLPGGDGVIRHVPALPGHATVQLAAALGEQPATDGEMCAIAGRDAPCSRIRFSTPGVGFHASERPILRLSELAACDGSLDAAVVELLRDRVVVLQTTAFAERVDLLPTPMTVAFGQPPRLSPGSQILADAVETHRLGDGPRRSGGTTAALWIGLAGLLGLVAGARWRPWWAVLTPVVVVAAMHATVLVAGAPTVLLPISASGSACLAGLLAGVGAHLALGTRRSRLTARYLPAPVRRLLLQAGGPDRFRDRKVFATVLISDIMGYTTLTDLLGSPGAIFSMLNDYLDYTTRFMQAERGAWVEGYVGDEVCFYWPDLEELHGAGGRASEQASIELALRGALALAEAQQAWFSSLGERSIPGVPSERLAEVADTIGAGIGLAAGPVLMGNQGPEGGVQKFGILGAPLNLASRLEGLTRRFSTGLIVNDAVAEVATSIGLPTRLLGRIRVKGRIEVVGVFAVGRAEDPAFAAERLDGWRRWRLVVEAGGEAGPPPEGYDKDAATLMAWRDAGHWDADAGCWSPDQK